MRYEQHTLLASALDLSRQPVVVFAVFMFGAAVLAGR